MVKMAVLLLALSVVMPGRSVAAQANQPEAITIQPFLQEVSIESGQRQPSFFVEVFNNTPSLYSFTAQAVDFGSLDETGGVLFAGSQSSELVKKYGLAKWLVIENSRQSLAAGQKVRIKVKIDNRSDLSPGGHYAAIILSGDKGRRDAAEVNVSLQKNISALIFAKKTDGALFGLELNQITPNSNFLRKASQVKLEFFNPGNVHVVPRGEVKIIGPFNKLVGRGIINAESAIVLPETKRVLNVPIQSTGSAILPGVYRLEASFRYDGSQQLKYKTLSRFYYGWPLAAFTGYSLFWVGRRAYRAW